MNEQISALLQKKWVATTGIGVLAFSGGVGVGYILGAKLWKRVAVEAMDIIEEGSEVLNNIIDDTLGPDNGTVIELPVNKEDVNIPGDGLVVSADDFVENEPEDEPVLTQNNVFAGNDDEWDMAVESYNRLDQNIYVIHRDEFWDNESEYHQQTLVYYAGDDILVDDTDSPIYSYPKIVGELKFGHGSGDANLVFIENTDMKSQYEVIRDSGHYSVEVLGLDDSGEYDNVGELKHSLRKFKLDE